MAIERQMAPTLAGIDAKHVARYCWAAQYMVGRHVLDAACGCGYGSYLLSQIAASVRGIDRSEEAIAFAKEHYAGPVFMQWDLNQLNFPFAGLQGIVSLETIEHLDAQVEDTLAEWREALAPGGIVCISHPCNEPNRGEEANNPFHKQFWIDDMKLVERVVKLGYAVVQSKRQPGCKLYDYHLLALRKA